MNAERQHPIAAAAPARVPGGRQMLLRKCACGNHGPGGGTCDSCKRQDSMLQRKATRPPEHSDVPPIVDDVLRSPGLAIDTATRAFFEPRLQRDLSAVRLHTDASAASSAQAVAAEAYTVGQHVVFGSGRYEPHTTSGALLLAHELAHTIQQGNVAYAAGAPMRVSDPTDTGERQADRVAQDIVHGHAAATAVSLEPPQVARVPAAAPKTCPATHSIPDDIYKAAAEAWGKSGQAGATVTEHGGRIVTDSAGKRVIRTGAGGGGSINLPAEQAGDVTQGTFHTHPYSKAEGSLLGVGFSGGDIENFIGGGQGSAKYVHAGTCMFVLDTLDTATRDGCKGIDIKKRWNDKFAAAGGNFQLRADAATRTAIKGCGLCYYGACSPDGKQAIPKTANLG